MNKNWFTSDLHLGHHNVLKFDKRPFVDITIHDRTIIDNINSVVGQKDNVYFLGDFSLTNKKYTETLLSQLKGNLFFIKGNHDHKDNIKLFEKYGTFLGEQKSITINETKIVLNHFCMLTWDRSNHGAWHLHGHSHGNLKHPYPLRWLDVGINVWNYKPIEYRSIEKIMDEISFEREFENRIRR